MLARFHQHMAEHHEECRYKAQGLQLCDSRRLSLGGRHLSFSRVALAGVRNAVSYDRVIRVSQVREAGGCLRPMPSQVSRPPSMTRSRLWLKGHGGASATAAHRWSNIQLMMRVSRSHAAARKSGHPAAREIREARSPSTLAGPRNDAPYSRTGTATCAEAIRSAFANAEKPLGALERSILRTFLLHLQIR